MRAAKHEEFLRRNLIHASAIGAEANARAVMKRLAAQKRTPMWLLVALAGIVERCSKVHPEVAKWRNAAPDAPEYMK